MRLLIVKLSALGDLVHTFDALVYLRERFQDAHIDWLVDHQAVDLVRRHSALTHAIGINVKSFRSLTKLPTSYDLLFDLQGNIKSAFASCFAKAKRRVGFCYQDVAEWPNMLLTKERYPLPKGQNIREDYLSLVKAAFSDYSPHKLYTHTLMTTPEEDARVRHLAQGMTTLVAPGSRWKNKQLLQGTIDPEGKLFIAGNDVERDLVRSFGKEPLPRLTFGELIALLKQMKLVIGADSFPLHLAGALGIPTKAHFGPSSAKKYAPLNCQATQGVCPYNITFEKRCEKLRSCPTGACMGNPHYTKYQYEGTSSSKKHQVPSKAS